MSKPKVSQQGVVKQQRDEQSILAAICQGLQVENNDQWVITLKASQLLALASSLKSHLGIQADCLLDLCVVDYLHYGLSEWETEDVTHQGYSRACAQQMQQKTPWNGPRFVVVVHLLSHVYGMRIRLRVELDDSLEVPSLTEIWPAANWYEREAYDLFGVVFLSHPDLRRILTDYGFIGYPFRKDFPLVGKVEMRYDGVAQKCIYEPVTIENRVGVPKVIRHDNRYVSGQVDRKHSDRDDNTRETDNVE